MTRSVAHPNIDEIVLREIEGDPRLIDPSLWMPRAALSYETFYRREALVFDEGIQLLKGEEYNVSPTTFVGDCRIYTRKMVMLFAWSGRRREMLRIMTENGVDRVATWREYPSVILPVPDGAIINKDL